jgi:hypothetical protein
VVQSLVEIVPERVPVDAFRVSPVGRVPAATDHTSGSVQDDVVAAVNVYGPYAVLPSAIPAGGAGLVEIVIVHGAALTVMVKDWVVEVWDWDRIGIASQTDSSASNDNLFID